MAARTSSSRTIAPIELDGAYGEGGGALLRTALTMATLTQQPLHITNIRGATNHPGMDIEDHLILSSLASSCKAEVVGAEVGSQSITFQPTQRLGPVSLVQDVASQRGRGANGLVVLGSLLPVLARSGVYSELTVIGETYGANTLTYDYFANVTLAAARKMGLHAFPRLEVCGFGREQYGEVHLDVEPSQLKGVEWLNRGAIRVCRAVVVSAQLPPTIAARAVAHLERLASFSGLHLRISTKDVPGSSPGLVITTWAEFDQGIGGLAAVATRGVRVETVAQGAFEALSSFLTSNATSDAHLADQLLLIGTFADGPTSFSVPRLTKRLLTMVWVIKQFTPIHITVHGMEGKPGTITLKKS